MVCTGVGEFVVDISVKEKSRLVGPAPSDVPDSVPASPEDQCGDVEPLHKLDTLPASWRREEGGKL